MKFDITDEEEEYLEEEEEKPKSTNKKILYLILGLLMIALLIIIVTFVVLNSGNKENKKVPVTTPSTTISPSSTASPSPTTSQEEQKVTIVDEDSNTRPLAIVIDCEKGANQAGLQESYLNYELLLDGGITRCLALFKTNDVSLIGPIRSITTDFLDYALENDAILIHYGLTPTAEEDLIKYEVSNLNGMVDKDAFRRDTASTAPHNVYTRMTYINLALEDVTFTKESSNWHLLKYTTKEEIFQNQEEKQNATNIKVKYTESEIRNYTYDTTNKYYMRTANSEASLDRKTKGQLHYKNILILETEKETTDEGENLKTTGEGIGYYITNGAAKKINWKKEKRNTKTIYKYDDGTEVNINDGNTFIEIVPQGSTTIQ